MRVLVTGSSGTIGTELCLELLKGHELQGVDVRPNQWSPAVSERTMLRDLRKPLDLDSCDMAIHLAANARVWDLVQNPGLARDNFEMLFNVLEYARVHDVKRFLFASSREVYGNSDKHVHHEDEAYVKNCESPYTASKIGGEALVHSYQQCYGIDFVIVRFSNVYGRYDLSTRVVPRFISQAIAGQPLVVYGKDKVLDFTFISDAVDGILSCISRFGSVQNDTFNIASGTGSTLTEVAQAVTRLLRSRSEMRLEGSRTGEVVKYIADISKARRLLAFAPKVSLEDGLRQSVAWYSNVNLSPLEHRQGRS